ncbi:MAG TPA: FHA domain-containing protein, partial [Polyangiaceae bacterium]
MSFAPRADPPLEPAPTMACPLCGSSNQRGLRFCVTCGHLLAPSSAPPAGRGPTGTVDLNRTVPGETPKFDSAPPPALARPAAPAPAPGAGAPIAPGRVVELGGSAPAAMQRLCPRCRGASDHGAQFCRFCGGSLADAPAVALQPSPNPIAAAPPPPPIAVTPAPPPVPAHAPAAPAPQVPAPAVPAGAAVAAVAASVSRGRLVLIARDGGEGPSYPLGDSTDIGRTEGNIVIAEDRYISPRHARVAVRGGAYYVRDLESTNGLFIRIPFPRSGSAEGDQDRLQDHGNMTDSEQVLADQDLFLVGQQVLRFEVVKHAEEGFGVASENGTLLFGTPAAPRYARLSQRTVEGVVRDVFHIRKAETVIGRESGDIVFTDDPFLSRRHAVLRVHSVASTSAPRRFTLADLGSSNGT